MLYSYGVEKHSGTDRLGAVQEEQRGQCDGNRERTRVVGEEVPGEEDAYPV